MRLIEFVNNDFVMGLDRNLLLNEFHKNIDNQVWYQMWVQTWCQVWNQVVNQVKVEIKDETN